MVTQESLKALLVEVSGYNDFTLELLPKYSKLYWGRYFSQRKIVRLYALDEFGNQFRDDILMREGLHEVAHHICFHHTKQKSLQHDELFHEVHKALLDKHFNRTVPIRYSPLVRRIVGRQKGKLG